MFVVGEKYVWVRGIQNCYNALKSYRSFFKMTISSENSSKVSFFNDITAID